MLKERLKHLTWQTDRIENEQENPEIPYYCGNYHIWHRQLSIKEHIGDDNVPG